MQLPRHNIGQVVILPVHRGIVTEWSEETIAPITDRKFKGRRHLAEKLKSRRLSTRIISVILPFEEIPAELASSPGNLNV